MAAPRRPRRGRARPQSRGDGSARAGPLVLPRHRAFRRRARRADAVAARGALRLRPLSHPRPPSFQETRAHGAACPAMHCELIAPALFARAPGERLPALELLLARSRGTAAETRTLEEALYGLFEIPADPIAAGALTRLAAGESIEPGWWVRADPVHLRLMRDRLMVVPAEAFDVQPQEAAALCEALNRHFG